MIAIPTYTSKSIIMCTSDSYNMSGNLSPTVYILKSRMPASHAIEPMLRNPFKNWL